MIKWIFFLSAFSAFVCNAQNKKSNVAATNSDSILFSKIKYRLVGPFRGGRVAAVTGSYKNKSTFYFGSVGGGVYKTTDGGSNWKNMFRQIFWWNYRMQLLLHQAMKILFMQEKVKIL